MAETYFIIHDRLNEDAQYAGLTVLAKFLYGKMRDTLKLSIQNNWRDENGYFIYMKRERMCALLGCCLPTARKAVRALIDAGLLDERRQGLTRPNKLYVRLFPGEDEGAFVLQAKKQLPAAKKPDFTPDGNASSPNHRKPIQMKPQTEEIKNKHFWALREGDIFKYGDEFFIQEDGEVTPYRFGQALREGTVELLAAIGMSPGEIAEALGRG